MTLTLSGTTPRPLTAAAIAAVSRPSLNAYSPTNPIYIAHRNAPLRYPEETIVGMDACLAAGVLTLECDVNLLTDGGLGLIHDTTAGRTATTNPTISALSSAQFKDLVLPADTFLAAPGFGNLAAPLFTEYVARYAGKAILVPEAKSTGSGAPMVTILNAYGVAQDQVLIQSFIPAELTPAISAGYQCIYLVNDATGLATAQSLGVKWVGISNGAADADVRAYIAAGFKTVVFTVDRRWERDKYLAMGAVGFFTNDPEYLSTNSPASNADTFATLKWPRGMLASDSGYSGGPNSIRGSLAAPGYLVGPHNNSAYPYYVNQGWACPVKNSATANSFTLYFDLTFVSAFNNDTSRWVAVWLADARMGDALYDDGNTPAAQFGYNLLIRKDGRIQIYVRTQGSVTNLATTTGTTIADGTELRYSIVVTPTAITLNQLNASGAVAASVTVNDSTYRGGYFSFGRNGINAQFRNVRVV